LTGLPNRSVLNRHLAEALKNAPAGTLALLLIDLDRFKDVNDVLGHQTGDALLCEAAERLREGFGDAGFVARLGGDEFAIVLSGERAADATAVAQRIVETLGRPFVLPAQRISIGGTVGVAFATSDATAAALLRQADVAMYTAKRRRSGVAVYAADDDGRAISRLTMANALPSAIIGDQLVLYYQPQLEIATGAVKGAEALVRWQHPERGLLLPDLFLPIAEEIGMIERLTDWVLRTAVEQMQHWNAAGMPIRVSVNLSAQDLHDARLARTIPRLLGLHGVPPSQLCLELTETTVVAETELAAECLHLLAAGGVRVAIDDFGTGYSSLSHLKQFPVDEVKIDRQFVIGMERDPHDAAIVRSTIELAHRLNVDVVVEGVEDDATFGTLARLGADFAQGYAISRPLTAAAFATWLQAHRRSGSTASISAQASA
jgi:diguanylate cyclase (GGDEF)-like protein